MWFDHHTFWSCLEEMLQMPGRCTAVKRVILKKFLMFAVVSAIYFLWVSFLVPLVGFPVGSGILLLYPKYYSLMITIMSVNGLYYKHILTIIRDDRK
jgi:hypothetical protein